MERKLASVQVIAGLQPIPDADLIEVATINAWKLVVKKGEFAIGDRAVYCEIDSFLPLRPEFEFLRKTSFKKMGDKEGFRLKTIKLRGQVSQGLLIPLAAVAPILGQETTDALQPGDDVTAALGIEKYEPPIPASLSGVMRGNFPGFLRKTDEERIQNMAKEWEKLRTGQYYVTEKLDGSSVTYYHNNGVFGVCSRNLDLLDTEDNTLWKVARQMNMETMLRGMGNFALQGELIGEGVQGNPYKLRGQTVHFFNCFDIDNQAYLPYEAFVALDIPRVPVLEQDYMLPETIDALLAFAEGKSTLQATAEREGIVIRSHDRRVSFKAISNKFLLNEK